MRRFSALARTLRRSGDVGSGPPPEDDPVGAWDFSSAAQSGQFLTAGF